MTYICMQMPGTFPAFGSWASFKNMAISSASSSGFTASVMLTVPDLNMVDAPCTVKYDHNAGSFVFTVGYYILQMLPTYPRHHAVYALVSNSTCHDSATFVVAQMCLL